MTQVEPEIEHLDFDPHKSKYQPIRYVHMTPREKKEPEKTCTLRLLHPNSLREEDRHPCGRPGYVIVDLEKDCGHSGNGQVTCKPCWERFQEGHSWRCSKVINGVKCNVEIFMRHVVAWRRIK